MSKWFEEFQSLSADHSSKVMSEVGSTLKFQMHIRSKEGGEI